MHSEERLRAGIIQKVIAKNSGTIGEKTDDAGKQNA